MPCDGYWSYAWSTYILTAEQIGTPILINEIQFDVDNNPSNYTMNNQQLYLKQTTANTVSGSYPEPTNNDFTLVFDGSVTWDGRGWQGVFLDSEFAYDGNSNLQLVWLNNRGACPSGYPLFKKTDTGVNSGAYQQSNNNVPAISGSIVPYFPNTRISGLIPGLISFSPAHYATDISLTPTLSLEVDDRYTHFALYFGTNPSSLTNLIPYSPITDLISYTFTEPLDDCTDYYWRVNLADNNSGYTSFIFSFRTLISMSGSGTIQDPYLIDNIADLKTLSSGSSLWDKHFLQTSDIDASSAYVSPIGKYPDYFSGSYDGQNHTISNLRLSSSLPGFGLFGRTENANISNLGLIDVSVVGAGNVGGLIGRGVDITINNCYVTGTVCAVGFSPGPNGELTPGGNCGGLAGHLEYSFIDNSYARVSVNSISKVVV